MTFSDKIKSLNLSKREKYLLIILFFIIFELIIYSLFISNKYVSLQDSAMLVDETKNNVKMKEEVYKKALELQKENESLLRNGKLELSNLNNKEDIESFKGNTIKINKIEDFENRRSLEFTIEKKNIKDIKRLSDYLVFENLNIVKESQNEYKCYAEINKGSKNSKAILPTIVESEPIDKDIDLKKAYFSERINESLKEDDNKLKINNEKNSSNENLVTETPSKDEKVKNRIFASGSLLDKTDKDVPVGELIPDYNTKEFDTANFKLYSDEKNLIFLKNDDNEMTINYVISPESQNKEILILFDNSVNVKDLKLKIESFKDQLGEMGYYNGYKVPFDEGLTRGVNEIDAGNIENLKGIYFKPAPGNDTGEFKIYDIEGKL
ncbi:hypothetical protein [Peptoniphilus catoniae]|uniref:hypothetical protein n=1 Tax=Peptoniphilus catoniae TaxID=1660341 RepID=UPI0010FD6E0A|nr:hypothetical protein [Peptoniphilus catoniae]